MGLIEYKFTSPLVGNITENYTGNTWGACDSEIIEHLNEITEACKKSIDEPTGLAQYIWEEDGEIYEKVKDIRVTVEVIKGKPVGVAYVKSEKLTSRGIEDIKEYLSGQYSDGWGEGFEQRHVHEWHDDVDIEEYDDEEDEFTTESVYTRLELYISFWYYGTSWEIELEGQKEI